MEMSCTTPATRSYGTRRSDPHAHLNKRVTRPTTPEGASGRGRTFHPGARMQGTLQTTTTFSIEGYRITEYKGLVRGIVVRSPTIGQGLLGGLKQLIGGQIGAYAEMCEQAREQAYELLLQHARELRANAVVGVRYESSEVGRQGSATEVLCYGTAVVIQRA